ncbi:hypothetical protein PQU94_15045 [Asticcacaulis sp. DXS10W]|uniref:Uncharacterized protein n=1 Tax=Asticcacaulis currens TaxID=2984210 RepID=A0ABT5II04_9CAUL|nr:hypothetical protein [Asticcacaulis currens]MDC7695592.1 hypothetical protein [Asticcacaulis currens]
MEQSEAENPTPDATQIAISTIKGVLETNPDFKTVGVLTAKIGDDFKLKHPDGSTFKAIFPELTISRFIKEHMSEYADLVPSADNPVRIHVRSKSAQPPERLEPRATAYLRGDNLRLPKKLFKLRSFLSTLSEEERASFKLDGNMILSLMRDEA